MWSFECTMKPADFSACPTLDVPEKRSRTVLTLCVRRTVLVMDSSRVRFDPKYLIIFDPVEQLSEIVAELVLGGHMVHAEPGEALETVSLHMEVSVVLVLVSNKRAI